MRDKVLEHINLMDLLAAKPGQSIDYFDLQPTLGNYLLRMEDFQEQE